MCHPRNLNYDISVLAHSYGVTFYTALYYSSYLQAVLVKLQTFFLFSETVHIPTIHTPIWLTFVLIFISFPNQSSQICVCSSDLNGVKCFYVSQVPAGQASVNPAFQDAWSSDED